jgi:hypothetical protein
MSISAQSTGYAPGAEDWWSDFNRKPSSRRPEARTAPRVYDNPGYTRTREPAPRALRRNRAEKPQWSRLMMYMTAAVLVIGLVVQVGRLAQIASSAKQISTLNAEIKDIQGQKETLEVMLSMQQNLTRIRNEAINKCEMTYPTEDQIRVVSLMGSGADPLTQTASTSQEAKPAD